MLEAWPFLVLFLIEDPQAHGMQTITIAGLVGGCWIGASYGGEEEKIQTRSTAPPPEREQLETQDRRAVRN